MGLPALKLEATAPVARPVQVLTFQARTPSFSIDRVLPVLRRLATAIVPPAIVVALVLLVWELACRQAGAGLPPPSTVLRDTWELIKDPFFDRGGIDKGLFWHISASLQRVALGYALAALAGIALGTLVGQSAWGLAHWSDNRSGRCAASIRCSRCCARSRRWPGCRWRWPPSATVSLRRSS